MQLQLDFKGPPDWWTPGDEEAIERYQEWERQHALADRDNNPLAWTQEEAEAFIDAHAYKWTCRRPLLAIGERRKGRLPRSGTPMRPDSALERM